MRGQFQFPLLHNSTVNEFVNLTYFIAACQLLTLGFHSV
jgi:hypothetical protein